MGVALFQQALRGIRVLHDKTGFSHNDIKPENILLERGPAGPNDTPRLVLADFGCVALAAETGGSLTQAAEAAAFEREVSVCEETGGSLVGGDRRYRSPEVLFGEAAFGFATDAWACGVLFYEILSGGLLVHIYDRRNVSDYQEFCDVEDGNLYWDFMEATERGDPIDMVFAVGEDDIALRSILIGLLHVDLSLRLSVQDALTLTEEWAAAIDGAGETVVLRRKAAAATKLQANFRGRRARMGVVVQRTGLRETWAQAIAEEFIFPAGQVTLAERTSASICCEYAVWFQELLEPIGNCFTACVCRR